MKERVTLKTSPADAGYSRLHITPLDSELLKVIVPAAILPNVRRISYHSIQTFPDKRYGFVDLPTADAVKIKNKLNGATLRGAKIHIEPARPENMPKPIPDAIVAPDATPKSKKSKSDKKDKKRKRDNLEITGVELEDGRKVKRGWTVTPEEAQAKKKKAKDEERKRAKSENKDEKKKRKRQEPESQYTDGPEALIKTRLPPNKLDDSTGQDQKKSKKSKKREVLVHEFANNTKFATFLKMTQPTPETGGEGASFVEGRGWVKEDGTVLEEVKSTRPRTVPKLQVGSMATCPQTLEADDDTSSSSGSSSEDAEPFSPSDRRALTEDISSLSNPANGNSAMEAGSAARPKSSASMRSLTIQIPATPVPAATKVHPLESLYKRQEPDGADAAVSKTSLVQNELFTFGGAFEDDLEDDQDQGPEATAKDDDQRSFQGSQLPMTPYSKQDFEWRNTRSAAPTPDTAHPSRISRIWPMGGDDDLDETTGDDAGAEMGEDGEEAVDKYQDFQQWFWKNRGQLDRAWRERRRVARKEKRHRDNKAKEDRAI